ncbi:helix-turn-helix domain-containing protein [Thiomicrorhabdus heinhorstiae]|uniref:Transcriptional regulator n=1 Tax=Thiomicrorhabdus heinhorstiae TaxID=2748010 RepID=A0ABS0BUA2_9GAMM|nr:helix-turn-helix domain-containing protein [Thiomicrorhabdus heinhorstiae]MBF6057418.1 transcriptional regulator [Thiomicrorhabdus heinhorstiae]
MTSNLLAGYSLSQRRSILEDNWNHFTEYDVTPVESEVSADISLSWRRSANSVHHRVAHAPYAREERVQEAWHESPLFFAAQKEQDNMVQLTREGDLVAAISDPHGCLLWSFASRHMRDRAESVNFQAGGRWDEKSIGTNAIGLSKTLRRPVTVFSSEHYQSFLHDWVCYAAPIIHPQSGECVGILDMSTTWNRHTSLGQAAVTELARNIAGSLPAILPKEELEIYALGQMRVTFRGKSLHLSKRQMEILCLLALNPQGLNLESFHAALYGDAPISSSTLKSELSHLRHVLGGHIGSRPYRLLVPVWADFIQVWQALHQQRINEAFTLYQGPLLAQSESPELEEWRHCIEAVMGKVLDACEDPKLLLQKLCAGSAGNEMVRERLVELIST